MTEGVEQANTLQDFDYEAFAKDLSQQASTVVPEDIKADDAKFIIQIIYRFCMMAGEALVKEEGSTLNASQAMLVTQFIGEWIFHKSIDIIRAQIDPQYREPVLQKVAFTVFDIAKKAVEKDLPQEQLITLVEAQVVKSFTAAIGELEQKGLLSDDAANNALHQSNIDAMAQSQVQEETQTEIALMNDTKMIKLASLAILMKNFTPEKMKSILSQFDKPERDVLIGYLKMPDLEDKLDINTAMKCLEEMKNALPETVVITYDKAHRRMCKIVNNSSREEILDIIKNERPAIQEFVLACYHNKKRKLPARIADIVSRYLEENVS